MSERRTDQEFERALRGVAPAGDPVADFVRQVRDAGFGPGAAGTPDLDEATAQTHIAAIVAAAREAAHEAPAAAASSAASSAAARALPGAGKRALRLVLVAAAAMLALSGISTGLAMAGVIHMPSPARTVLRHIGIHLPGDAGHKQKRHDGPRAPEGTASSGPRGGSGGRGNSGSGGSGGNGGRDDGGNGGGGSDDQSGSGDHGGSGSGGSGGSGSGGSDDRGGRSGGGGSDDGGSSGSGGDDSTAPPDDSGHGGRGSGGGDKAPGGGTDTVTPTGAPSPADD
jgi:hypothetical protein